ncbi:unnamed protein product [Haemonchus placei]|uniref:Uncharacterized protein n=1 Tax=Haemonchus placei TaxID=6290 RepID=A0A0N4X7I8_HAEPC|nr:unnamed protein product [Haemonchus placei]
MMFIPSRSSLSIRWVDCCSLDRLVADSWLLEVKVVVAVVACRAA